MCKKVKILYIILMLHSVYAASGVLSNFKIPLFSEQNTQEGFIAGEEAVFRDENTIVIKNASADFSVPDMRRKWNIKTENCVYRKKEGVLSSDDYVRMQSEGIIIDGEGMEWKINRGRMSIKKNVTVDVSRNYSGEAGE